MRILNHVIIEHKSMDSTAKTATIQRDPEILECFLPQSSVSEFFKVGY